VRVEAAPRPPLTRETFCARLPPGWKRVKASESATSVKKDRVKTSKGEP
jgi:hypothetical protein